MSSIISYSCGDSCGENKKEVESLVRCRNDDHHHRYNSSHRFDEYSSISQHRWPKWLDTRSAVVHYRYLWNVASVRSVLH